MLLHFVSLWLCYTARETLRQSDVESSSAGNDFDDNASEMPNVNAFGESLIHRDFSGVVSVLICDEMVDIIFEEMR
jgi:hypothetical protein